jgi:hypothetical protein
MKLTDWLLVEVAQQLIGRTQISVTKSGFYHPSVIDSLSGCGLCDLEAGVTRDVVYFAAQ